MELMKKKDTGVHPKEIHGISAFVDTERDLYAHINVPGDSCFVVANVTGDDGNRYNFLIHSGALIPEDNPTAGMMVSMISLTDVSNKTYLHEEKSFPILECTFAPDNFHIESPLSCLKGSSQAFTAYGILPDGRGTVQAKMENYGPALYNGGNGKFLCMNDKVTFHHYGIPYLKTEGIITLDGKQIRFEGDAWLDRQWGLGDLPLPLIMAQDKVQTKWMDLNLSNGYKVSLWDILADDGIENAWATILSPEGVHIVAPMTPLAEYEEDYWYSEATGNYYPTKYIVELPGLNTKINVSVYDGLPHQEAVSVSGYHRYEAHSDCAGIFMGEEVTGFCCIELVGNFGQQLQETYAFEDSSTDNTSYTLDNSIDGTYKGTLHSPIGEQEIVFHYAVKDGALTGSVTLLGKTSEIFDAKAIKGGFTHGFKMKPPIGVGSVKVTVVGSVEGNQLTCQAKTPMGTFDIVCYK